MLSKVKNFFKRNAKPCVTALAVAMVSAMSCLTCFAADGDAIETAFTGALSTLQSDLLRYLGLVVPVALAIVAGYLCMRKAISWVKGMIGR